MIPSGASRLLREQAEHRGPDAGGPSTRRPGRRASPGPRVGWSSRPRPRSRVDLPHALAPTTTVTRAGRHRPGRPRAPPRGGRRPGAVPRRPGRWSSSSSRCGRGEQPEQVAAADQAGDDPDRDLHPRHEVLGGEVGRGDQTDPHHRGGDQGRPGRRRRAGGRWGRTPAPRRRPDPRRRCRPRREPSPSRGRAPGPGWTARPRAEAVSSPRASIRSPGESTSAAGTSTARATASRALPAQVAEATEPLSQTRASWAARTSLRVSR